MKYFSILLLFITFHAGAQLDPVAYFSFDDCNVSDEQGLYADGSIMNSIDCDCGVGDNSMAFYYDGSGDTMSLDPSLKSLFDADFSISFYLWMDPVSEISSIMSIQGDCSNARDSAFFMRYFPSSNELVVELSKNFGEIIALRAELPEDNCWNHVLFTREGQVYSLYINGEFIDRFTFFDRVVLGRDYPFWIGVSPCVGSTEVFFNGRIDELKFFDFALKSESQLLLVQEFPDQILSADTTIFEGSAYPIITSTSCADQLQWNPAAGLSDPLSDMPVASPEVTTEYTVSFNHGSCISRDRIRISVLSEEDIQCGNILLPKAFTPNNDGINEKYGISNGFIIEELRRFEIYDRWGLKIYESLNKSEMWDGTYQGKPMPPGVYVYKISYTCRGEQYDSAGSFNILK